MVHLLLVVFHHQRIIIWVWAPLDGLIKLMGINSTDDDETVTDGYSAILTAGQMGANIINLSFGGSGACGGYQSIIFNVYNNYGSILVTSAGNGDDSITLNSCLLQVVIMSFLYLLLILEIILIVGLMQIQP